MATTVMEGKMEPSKWNLCFIPPTELKNHAVNIEIYGTQSLDDDMLASVKEFGVIEPIRATKDRVMLSGHRRRQHAIVAKCETVPVLMAQHAISDVEQVIEIVESNRQREKTMEMKAREYARLSEAKAEQARKRQAHGKTAPGKTLGEKFPEASNGRAKDAAAKEVGLSRPTAEKAAEVVKVIDEAKAKGDTQKADELREKLNTGTVAAAHRAASSEPGVETEPEHHDGIRDGLDGTVPVALRPVFVAVKTFRGLVQKIGKIQNEIEELQRSDAGAAIPINEILKELPKIQAGIKFAIPYCECAKCRRELKDNCTVCQGLGWTTEATFNRSRTPEDEQWLKSRS
jgi:hypothetical protein